MGNHDLIKQARDTNKTLQSSQPSDATKLGRARLTKQKLVEQMTQCVADFESIQKNSKQALQNSMNQARERHEIRRASVVEDHHQMQQQAMVFQQQQQQMQMQEDTSIDVDLEIVREREAQLRKLE